MTQYSPYIFGIISLLIGLIIFLFSFKILIPKKRREESKSKVVNFREKFETLMKVCSIILILNGAYDLIIRDSEKYQLGFSERTVWNDSDREHLINCCLQEVLKTKSNYPELSKQFCACSVDNIMSKISYTEHLRRLEKTPEEQDRLVAPLLQECLNEFREQCSLTDLLYGGRIALQKYNRFMLIGRK